MTTYTTEDLINAQKSIKEWISVDGIKFVVTALYCPAENNDTWVTYVNQATLQEFNCRWEVFARRFRPLIN